jgi:adenylosuccinate synthase
MPKAIITVDLGWGDSGKGTIVDALARKNLSTLVVRYSGGSQCGHNVVTDEGVHHEFSQFNSATFAGAATLLSKHVLVNPLDMVMEAEVLTPKHKYNPLFDMWVDERALVTTPYHVAMNRIRETLRTNRHGSCGKGIRETVVYAEENPKSAIVVKDLRNYSVLKQKLNIMHLKLGFEAMALLGSREMDSRLQPMFDIFWQDLEALTRRLVLSGSQFRICNPDLINKLILSERVVIFEASQGVLLDQDYGFRPHITKSTCTTKNAHEVLDEAGFNGDRFELGIVRTYMNKHGAGPFPTEDKDLTDLLRDEHNEFNPWQQNFRVGYLDIPALRYAIEANGGIHGLAITHLDVLDKLESWKVALGYQREDLSTFQLEVNGTGRQWQESLTKELEQVKCNSVYVQGDKIPELISSALNAPIKILSSGPKTGDKKFIGELNV